MLLGARGLAGAGLGARGLGGHDLAVHPAGARPRTLATGTLGGIDGGLREHLVVTAAVLVTAAAVVTPAPTATALVAVTASTATALAAASTILTAGTGRLAAAQVLELLRAQARAGALGLRQGALDALGDVEIAEQVLRGGVGLHGLGGLQSQLAGDEGPASQVLPVHEGDRGALLARAAGAAGAVQVRLVVVRAVPVDHVGDVVHVDAASRDIRGHQHVDLAVAEGPQGLLTGALTQVAVQWGRCETARGEILGDLVGLPLGAHEHDRQTAATGLQHPGHHLDLVELMGAVHDLLDVRLGAGQITRVMGPDMGGLDHEAAGQGQDRPRHGRREQHGLALRGHSAQQLLDVLEEAQVQHLVGLVQHRDPHLGEVQVLLAHQVDQAAGSAHHHLDAPVEGLDLRLVGATAVHGEDPHRALRGGVLEVLGHLHRELAGGQHHEGLRLAGLSALGVVLTGRHHRLQQRDAEAQGLAGAGLGLADDVATAQGDRQGHRLDREGMDDPLGGQGLDDVGADVEVRERLLGDRVRRGAGALLDGGGGRHGLIGVRGGIRHRSTLLSWICPAMVARGGSPPGGTPGNDDVGCVSPRRRRCPRAGGPTDQSG